MPDASTTALDDALQGAITPGTTYYLSLHSASPGDTGANEISGGSYARQAITFGDASGGSMASTDAQNFTGMPAESGNLWFGIYTAATGGTYLLGDTSADGSVTGPVAAGAQVTYSAGQITVSAS